MRLRVCLLLKVSLGRCQRNIKLAAKHTWTIGVHHQLRLNLGRGLLLRLLGDLTCIGLLRDKEHSLTARP